MAISSRINSSLKKKRIMGFFKKTLYGAIFILLFAALFILMLTSDKLIISDISVSGNSTISKDSILSIVESKLGERYLWIIRTDNLFLIKNSDIKEEIFVKFPKIESVKIGFHSLNAVEVAVSERVPADVWCSGSITNLGQCYFMDKNGFVYAEAPKFSGNPYSLYFGLLNSDNPIGQSYLDKNKFEGIVNLFNKLTDMKFAPQYFNALDEHQYEIGLFDGGKIKIDDKQSFDKSISNLQALIDSGYIKTDPAFLKKLNYIDLRFGNKVPFDVRK